MAENMEARIGAAKLVKRDRETLDYILKNKKQACFHTANEIAETLGVSPSSIVRLAKKLGYENFAAFRRSLQQEVASMDFSSLTEAIPYDKISVYEDLSDAEILATFSRDVLANIKTDLSAEMDQKLIESADMIVKARRVYFVGFRSCYGYASSMGTLLSNMRPDVVVVGDARPMVETLIDIGPQDLMIAISFKRYSSNTAFAVKMARDAGCPVVAMTDSYTAPIAIGAEKVVINNVGNMSFFDSHVSLLMNLEKILLLVSKRDKKKFETRLLKLERYLKETGQY